jgi:hypothetical protein
MLLNIGSAGELIKRIEDTRRKVIRTVEKYYERSHRIKPQNKAI